MLARTRGFPCRAVFGALIAASGLAPTAAFAQVALAVLPFEGAGAPAMRREVTDMLVHESRVRVADAATVDAAVARLGEERRVCQRSRASSALESSCRARSQAAADDDGSR